MAMKIMRLAGAAAATNLRKFMDSSTKPAPQMIILGFEKNAERADSSGLFLSQTEPPRRRS
jgi:hypothetical protein